MKKIITFYDDLLIYHYNNQKSKDIDPEVVPVAFISFCQASHILLIYIVLNHFFNFTFLRVEYSIIIIYIIMVILNYYLYFIKNRIESIIDRNPQKRIKIKSFFYTIFCFASPLLLIVLLKKIG